MTTKKTKPKMSKTEASYHANAAGMAAAEKIREGNPDALCNNALIDTTNVVKCACGWFMFPLTIGTLITRERARARVKDHLQNDPNADEYEKKYIMGALDNMCFADPHRVNDMIRDNDVDLIVAEAQALNMTPIQDRKKLMDHQAEQLAIFSSVAGEEYNEEDAEKPGK